MPKVGALGEGSRTVIGVQNNTVTVTHQFVSLSCELQPTNQAIPVQHYY
jgi:hypothetical protein